MRTLTFGQRLKLLRLAKGLTQADLAAAVGVHQSYISLLELDKAQPTLEVLGALARVLEVSLDALAGLDPQARSIPAWLRDFERYGRYLSPAHRQLIVDLMRGLAGETDAERPDGGAIGYSTQEPEEADPFADHAQSA